MKYFIKSSKKTNRIIFPNDINKFGCVRLKYCNEWYCPTCGTFYLPLYSGEYETYEKLLCGETVNKQVECKEEFLSDYDERTSCGGNGIFIETRTVTNLERAITTKSNFRNRPYYNFTKNCSIRFTDAFISSRDSLERVEIIRRNDYNKYTCKYCKSDLISGAKVEDFLEPADSFVQESLPRYAYYGDEATSWEYDNNLIKGWTEKGLSLISFKKSLEQNELYKKLSKEVDGMIEKMFNSHFSTIKNTSSEKVDLGLYINHLLNLEMDIRLSAEILKKLKLKNTYNEQRVTKYRCASRVNVEEKLSDAELKLKTMTCKLCSLDITPQDVNLTIPVEPIYKKPSFFNRKKIEAENAEMEADYKKRLSDHNLEYAKRKEAELSRRRIQNATAESEYKQKQNELQKMCEVFRQQIDANEFDKDNPYLQIREFYVSEILSMEEKLNELCSMKKDLLSLGIIHPKYQDFIPLTTIAEYLETGRCDALVGPNGAYNIYEQEIRANIIISKLDVVIHNLEQIRENQYKAYSLLSSMNASLDRMANSLDKAVTTLDNIQNNTENIAYYTERTAHFAKIQNELTDSMGLLIALK